jgi:hypothetical protein
MSTEMLDTDRDATTTDPRDDQRLLVLVGLIVAGAIALVAIRPLRRAVLRVLSVAWRIGGTVAIAKLVADLFSPRGETDDALARDDESELDWELPDEMAPDEPPVKRTRRASARR